MREKTNSIVLAIGLPTFSGKPHSQQRRIAAATMDI